MRITCDVIQDLMPSYIDGILSEDSKALVEEHMGTCQECRKMLEIMKDEQGKEHGVHGGDVVLDGKHAVRETERHVPQKDGEPALHACKDGGGGRGFRLGHDG